MAKSIPAIKVKQWLPKWDKVTWEPSEHRAEPEHQFYVFSMKARDLKRLSDIYRRGADKGISRSEDLGVQRRHDEKRSKKIKDYLLEGYPYCDLTENLKKSEQHESLRKPGWLPTGIVINILKPTDERRNKKVAADELVSIEQLEGKDIVSIKLPQGLDIQTWVPSSAAPIEVIDGQHRLWAFDEEGELEDFELPVIAFYGLDISWQAYLFWSINVSPVRINPSLAFDMYPLLRAEDWVNKMDGHKVYREARAQELVECLWLHHLSPWKNKINMLAEPGYPFVNQAGWARALMDAFIKSFDAKKSSGGLFGGFKNKLKDTLPWTRAQQAALLIFVGKSLNESIKKSTANWVEEIRKVPSTKALFTDNDEPGMFSQLSLLNSDQGIRGLWRLINDICVIKAEEWQLFEWQSSDDAGNFDESVITEEIISLEKQEFAKRLRNIAETLANFDWRSSSAEGLTYEQKLQKKALRGSGGYVELRNLGLIFLIEKSQDAEVVKAAKIALSA
jgi:hypothetical protein